MTNFITGLDQSIQFEGGKATAAKLTINTQQAGTPYQAIVQISDRRVGIPLNFAKTNVQGELKLVVPAKYATRNDLLVVAIDNSGTYNAVVADRVQAELMP